MAPVPRRNLTVRHCRRATLLLAAAALAAPATAAADITMRPARDLPVELLQPANGEILEAGREATIAWRPLHDLAADGIEEWEAFLSFDGGRRWPVRVTPHLDAEVTSFSFVMPSIPADDVRLMLRFGDERREVGFVLPLALRSVAGDAAGSRGPQPQPAFEQGEVARPGGPGVVLWVEGGRDGCHPRLRASAWTPPTRCSTIPSRLTAWPTAIPPDRRLLEWSTTPPLLVVTARIASTAASSLRVPAPALSLLALLCRQNE